MNSNASNGLYAAAYQPASMLPQRIQDRLVDLEVKDREHKREREGQALKEPFSEQLRFEPPANDRDLLPRKDKRKVHAAECVLGGVGPHEVRDAGLDLDPDEHEREQDGALKHDRRRFVAQALNRVQGVAEKGRVGRQDHEQKARHQEAAQAGDGERDGKDHKAGHRHQDPQRHDVAQVALDLGGMAGALANVEDVETEIEDHAHDGRVVDECCEGSVRRRREPSQRGDHSDQGDESCDHLRRKHEHRVAEGPRT